MNRLCRAWIIFWSGVSFFLEEVWSRCWPSLSFIFFYSAIALLKIPHFFGESAPAVFMILSLLALLMLLRKDGKNFKAPTLKNIEHYIERQNQIRHRPFATLKDSPYQQAGTKTKYLWQRHIDQTREKITRLRACLPKPTAHIKDRYNLRHIALLFFIVAWVAAGADRTARIHEAFVPHFSLEKDIGKMAADVWITPPGYMHQQPVFLLSSRTDHAAAQNTLTVPENSVLNIRLSGLSYAPRIWMGDTRFHADKDNTSGGYTLTIPLTISGTLKIKNLLWPIGSWMINVTPNTPPQIILTKAEKTIRALLKIDYSFDDDDGLKNLQGRITRAQSIPNEDAEDAAPIIFDIPPPSGKGDNNFTIDLTSHLWAGHPVELTLTGTDNVGHTASSNTLSLTLPERVFTNPLAIKLITARKILQNKTDQETRQAIARDVYGIMTKPDLYKGNIVTFMAFGSVIRRLVHDGDRANIRSVQQLLWEIAIRLEDDGLSVAAQTLSEELQRLSQALENKDTPKSELQEQITKVQKALQNYFQAMNRDLQQSLNDGQKVPPDIAEKIMKNIDMDKVMQQLRSLSQGDAREVMKKMADQLRNAVENIDPEQMKKLREEQMKQIEALKNLDDIVKNQKKLMDDTAKLSDGAGGEKESQQQKGLRQKLGDVMRKLGEGGSEIPDNFGKADQDMKNSAQQLDRKAPEQSLPHQQSAVDELQKGSDDMAKKMAEKIQQSLLMFGMPPADEGYGEGYDPLGRPQGQTSGDVKIPDQQEQRRIQQILKELQSRSNNYRRPKVERDYLDRLLDTLN